MLQEPLPQGTQLGVVVEVVVVVVVVGVMVVEVGVVFNQVLW